MSLDKKKLEMKKTIIIAVTLLLTVLYFVLIDPDLGLITDLPFGTGLVLSLQIFLIAAIGIIILETFPDIFMGTRMDDEEHLINKAATEPNSAAMVMMAKSIRLLAYSIIIGASIFGFTIN